MHRLLGGQQGTETQPYACLTFFFCVGQAEKTVCFVRYGGDATRVRFAGRMEAVTVFRDWVAGMDLQQFCTGSADTKLVWQLFTRSRCAETEWQL